MKKLATIVACVFLGACSSSQTLYEWGSYQPALLKYVKAGDATEFEAELQETIAAAESKDRVPPGLYAELGYMLYERGEFGAASSYFEKEKLAFPESAVLMEQLIAGTQRAEEAQ